MALTKAGAALDAPQEIAQNTLFEGATGAIADAYEAQLLIFSGPSEAVAHTGTQITVQISGETSGDEDWADHATWVGPTGTGNVEVITNNPASVGSATITIASTTGYLDTGWRFLEDVGSFANSEFVYEKAWTASTSITIVDGLTREHAQNSILNNIAQKRTVQLPMAAQRVRVLYDNTYDADGATVAVQSRLVEVTGV